MLIYDPALDPYHTAVRIMAIAVSVENKQSRLPIDTVRIADYYLTYPYKISSFILPAKFRHIRTAAKAVESPYRHAVGKRIAFERLRPIFQSALAGLAAAGLLDTEELKRGALSPILERIPAPLETAIARFQARQNTVGKFILSEFLAIPISGDAGLKQRSGLLEYRYDAV